MRDSHQRTLTPRCCLLHQWKSATDVKRLLVVDAPNIMPEGLHHFLSCLQTKPLQTIIDTDMSNQRQTTDSKQASKHISKGMVTVYVWCRTPEYMSPELLHNGQDGSDQAYDPRSTDVWAAGVMLVVALCGAFPFDHTQHHHRSMEEAELDLWYALTNSPAMPSLGQCWPRRCGF